MRATSVIVQRWITGLRRTMAFEVNFRNAVNVALIKYAFNNSKARTGNMSCLKLIHVNGVCDSRIYLVEMDLHLLVLLLSPDHDREGTQDLGPPDSRKEKNSHKNRNRISK